ncbi:MAG: tetratricopeptide repeat protein [candidate division Zixibacteria bacterium]|nr:tetratricopeptide repeat protein [candidate division Zixibacteria bacterium]
METYRVSSKVRDHEREYLIQTMNDAHVSAVSTIVYVNGVQKEISNCPHPAEVSPQEILSLVKVTHGEKKKEIETLLQAYHRAITSTSPDMAYHLGLAFFFKGFIDEAHQLFSAAVSSKADYHEALNYLGLSETALGRNDLAIEALSRAVELRPAYADYRNNLGEVFLDNNVPTRAILEFEQAIGINMYYADAYLNLGLAYLQQELTSPTKSGPSAALGRISDSLRKAALIHPGYGTPQYEEGLSAVAAGDLLRAFAVFKRIRETRKENHRQEFSSFYMRFVAFPDLVSEKVVTERIEFLKGEIAKNPNYVDLHAELGHCFLEQARLSWQQAIEEFRHSSEINPSLVKLRSTLETAEKVYVAISQALTRISEKG